MATTSRVHLPSSIPSTLAPLGFKIIDAAGEALPDQPGSKD